MTLQNIICGAIGGWAVLGCLIAPRLGRALKHADPGEDSYEPPTAVPQPDSSWMDLVSSDCLRDGDPLISERFFALVEGQSWFGGALNNPRHLKGDVA